MVPTSRALHVRVPRFVFLAGILTAMLIPVAAQAAGSSPYVLMASCSPDRSSALALSAAQIGSGSYIFLSPATGVTEASFWLDDTAAGGSAP